MSPFDPFRGGCLPKGDNVPFFYRFFCLRASLIFVEANFLAFCPILFHLQQMLSNQKDFQRRKKISAKMFVAYLFGYYSGFLINVKKCVCHEQNLHRNGCLFESLQSYVPLSRE